MLAGTLTTLIDSHWQNSSSQERLDQLINAFLKRSNTTIYIEGPNQTERIQTFLKAYTQLSKLVIQSIFNKGEVFPNSKLIKTLKSITLENFIQPLKCDQLSIIKMCYEYLRVIEEISTELTWLITYDVTLANTLVHALLEPIGVHQLDRQSLKKVAKIRIHITPSPQPWSCIEDHCITTSKQSFVQELAKNTHYSSSPCFSQFWGIRWCIAIGL